MKLELNLMELNSLYVAVSNQLKAAKQDALEYPSEFFQNQLIIAEELVEKVQEALWDECKAVDEAVEKFRMDTGIIQMDKIQNLELDIELWEGERNYYASIGEWEKCNHINSLIESRQEEVDALKDEITK
jgi:hypothetical protein